MHLGIIADQLNPPHGNATPQQKDSSQQVNVSCQTTTQEWFEELDNEPNALTWPPNSSDSNPVKFEWDVTEVPIPTQQAANGTRYERTPSDVPVLTVQNMKVNLTVLKLVTHRNPFPMHLLTCQHEDSLLIKISCWLLHLITVLT